MKEARKIENNPLQVILNYTGEPPHCEHGPMLMFCRDQEKRFFACSAYRDRKLCPAYVLESSWLKQDKTKCLILEKDSSIVSKAKELTQVKTDVLSKIKILSKKERKFCHTCGFFILNVTKHTNHKIVSDISNELLGKPSLLLEPLGHSKKEAQYHFSGSTTDVILSLIKNSDATHVICLACPSIFEKLKATTSSDCLMLDLDPRFRQFYGMENFLLYNMFNHHFFEGVESKAFYEKFLTDGKNKLALVMDPPFGGKVDVIANTLDKIATDYKDLNELNSSDISMFWVFPYFMEPQIISANSNFQMMDYKVEYINHDKFQQGAKGRKQGSPVRIFTNISLERLVLPSSEGYHFCGICKRWTSPENRHCIHCNSCTSKDGRVYVHCSSCQRCVKPTWTHCKKCNRCALADHPCDLFVQQSINKKSNKRRKIDASISRKKHLC